MRPLRPSASCLAALASALSLSCSPPASPPPPQPPTAAVVASSSAAAPPAATVVPAASSSLPPSASASASAPAAPPSAGPAGAGEARSVDLGAFTHELKEPVVSLALGEPRVAALGDEPWMLEKSGWKKIAFPPKLRPAAGETRSGRIFFGRDDKPRIMGTRLRDGAPSQLYLRYKNEQWIEEKNEIGKLRDPPPQGMWGVLGHADPEVVCKVGDECIIKRRTGWKMLPAGNESPRVELVSGVAWALYGDRVARLEGDKRFVVVGGPAPFKNPGGVWAIGDEVWVTEPEAGRLHHFQKGTWSSEPSPSAEPRGLWGKGRDDLWLACSSGLAHYDGTSWSLVRGPTGPLAEVYGREGEVWAAGKAGVWSSRAAASGVK